MRLDDGGRGWTKVIVDRPTVIIDVDIVCYLSIYFIPSFLEVAT